MNRGDGRSTRGEKQRSTLDAAQYIRCSSVATKLLWRIRLLPSALPIVMVVPVAMAPIMALESNEQPKPHHGLFQRFRTAGVLRRDLRNVSSIVRLSAR